MKHKTSKKRKLISSMDSESARADKIRFGKGASGRTAKYVGKRKDSKKR